MSGDYLLDVLRLNIFLDKHYFIIYNVSVR
jgi:hypothetical protein